MLTITVSRPAEIRLSLVGNQEEGCKGALEGGAEFQTVSTSVDANGNLTIDFKDANGARTFQITEASNDEERNTLLTGLSGNEVIDDEKSFGSTATGHHLLEDKDYNPADGSHVDTKFATEVSGHDAVDTTATYRADGTLEKFVDTDQGNTHAWGTQEYDYDARGGIRLEIDSNDNGSSSRYTYDVNNHLDYQASYGGNGNIASQIDFDNTNSATWGRQEYTYDARGHVLSERDFNDNGTKTLYAYDASNHLDFQASFRADGSISLQYDYYQTGAAPWFIRECAYDSTSHIASERYFLVAGTGGRFG
jgi:hypothetical protein